MKESLFKVSSLFGNTCLECYKTQQSSDLSREGRGVNKLSMTCTVK